MSKDPSPVDPLGWIQSTIRELALEENRPDVSIELLPQTEADHDQTQRFKVTLDGKTVELAFTSGYMEDISANPEFRGDIREWLASKIDGVF